MLTTLYSSALTDLLSEGSNDFVGIYDLGDERFVRVNPAGVRIPAFPSEQALPDDPIRSRSLRFISRLKPHLPGTLPVKSN